MTRRQEIGWLVEIIGQDPEMRKGRPVTCFSGNYKNCCLWKQSWLQGSWSMKSLKDKCLTVCGFLGIICFSPVICKMFNHVREMGNMLFFTCTHCNHSLKK